jgi:uncharacterized protein
VRWRQVASGPTTTYVVVLDGGEEAVQELGDFVEERSLSAAQVTAVGAFRNAVVGWFDPDAKEYQRNQVNQQCEVLSLLGDVALAPGGPALHLHGVLGLSDGTTRGGHLLEGQVWPTLEVVLTETPAELRKTMRPEIGLALIDLDATS